MKKSFIWALVLGFVSVFTFSSCDDEDDPIVPVDPTEDVEYYKIRTFADQPYLGEVWWNGKDYSFSESCKQIDSRYKGDGAVVAATKEYNDLFEPSACTSWRAGKIHGRNLDWYNRNYATLIVHMTKGGDVKYNSVSMLSCNPRVTDEFLKGGTIPEEYRKWLCCCVSDGINECGVCINSNIVPYDNDKTVNLNEGLAVLLVGRYVLDNFATAREAVNFLRDHKVYQAFVTMYDDYSHFQISDPNETFIVEWAGNEFHAIEYKTSDDINFKSPTKKSCILSNFFNHKFEKVDDLYSDAMLRIAPTSMGLERYSIVDKKLTNAVTVESHLKIAESVFYTKYENPEERWITDLCWSMFGFDETKKLAWWKEWTPDGKGEVHYMRSGTTIYEAGEYCLDHGGMDKYLEYMKTQVPHSPDNNDWITQHSVAYDLTDNSFTIIMCEGESDGIYSGGVTMSAFQSTEFGEPRLGIDGKDGRDGSSHLRR